MIYLKRWPRKIASEAVDKDIAQGFHIVTTALLCNATTGQVSKTWEDNKREQTISFMSANACISRVAPEAFLGSPRDVEATLVAIYLDHTEVYDVYCLVPELTANEKIIWFQIPGWAEM